jgi:hypothetical protein
MLKCFHPVFLGYLSVEASAREPAVSMFSEESRGLRESRGLGRA